MIPLRDNQKRESVALVTLTLVALNVILYFWDRQGHVFGPSVVFVDLQMRPGEVLASIRGAYQREPNGDVFPVVTLFTSMFLHGGFTHLLGNMIFLLVFGPGIEEAIGPVRYALYYLAWGLAAAFAQIYVYPHSMVPVLGASGAIGGVLGSYFLLFPSNKIQVYFPILVFLSFGISAWVLLGMWFVWQILVPQNGVANWAHAGGFLAGMLTVLVMGGRSAILGGPHSDIEIT
ncbi:MAG: rhomboid family intramembrane serine protease [Fimbriimonas sp.]|nr:rhomboid family intramembrane serine protease [Fimbriimonas sp.]